MTPLIYSEAAQQDLAEMERDYLHLSPACIREAYKSLEHIEMYPAAGAQRDEILAGLRSWPFKKHIIFYLILKDGSVLIARVLHSARDVEAVLREEEP